MNIFSASKQNTLSNTERKLSSKNLFKSFSKQHTAPLSSFTSFSTRKEMEEEPDTPNFIKDKVTGGYSSKGLGVSELP